MSAVLSVEQIQFSQNQSDQFFRSPQSYADFTPTSDGKDILGCIHPTIKCGVEPGEFKIIRQLPGGIIGLALVYTAAKYSQEGETGDFATALDEIEATLPNMVGDAHYGCALDANKKSIIAEAKDPSDQTKDTTARIIRILDIRDEYRSSRNKAISGFGATLEQLENEDAFDFHHVANEQYHGHNNVYPVEQPNISSQYILNFSSKGKNPNVKPQPARLVQGYHDTIGENTRYVSREAHLNKEMTSLLVCNMVDLTAATMTAITKDKLDSFSFKEVYNSDSPYGISILEREVSRR